MPHQRFPHLFTPIKIRNVELRNRVAISGHFAGWWVGPGGLPSDSFAAYIEERSKGGVGLFVIGATSPEPGSGWMQNIDDAIIPRYKMLAEAGHRHGTKVFAQLCHPGFKPLPGIPIIEPAPSATPRTPPSPHPPVPVERLHSLVKAFGAAAGRAAKGGVDGVEVHSHESFLHAEMLNPYWNKRTDEYGGSLENRMRFLVETLQAMRKAVGPDMPVGVRLKLDDMLQRGMGPEEYREVASRLERLTVPPELGVRGRLVDYIIFTGGDGRFHHGPMPRPDGEWLPLMKEMRKATNLVIMHAGRITTPQMAERALADKLMDVVIMTKTHICDPHFTRKVFENRLDDIRYCTRCLQVCHGKMSQMSCVYNPFTKRELEWGDHKPAARRRKIVVVGGGPGGMEAAWNLSIRGHEVIVLEQSHRVGGQIWVGASSPMRKNWARIAEFYERQSRKGLFEVRLNTRATADSVLELQPDVVIIATGSTPNRYAMPGKQAMTIHELVARGPGHSKHALVYDGEGFNRALVAADLLSSKGLTVDFVTPTQQVGPKVESMMMDEMAHQLAARGVRFLPGYVVSGVDESGGIILKSMFGQTDRTLNPIDLVVALTGSKSQNELADSLRGRIAELHVIGDAKEPRTCEDATVEGAILGRTL